MPIIQFSEKDLLRGKLVTPGWYRVMIDEVGESLSKDQGSTNYPVEATILFNGDTGDVEFKGVPLDWNFNSKAIGFAVGYLKVLGVEVKPGVRFDLAKSKGEQIDVFIENAEYQGRMINRVNHKYREIRKDVQAAA